MIPARWWLKLIFGLAAPWAAAAELIPPGIQPKVDGGGGDTGSRGAPALFYNPANVIYSKRIDPYFDISYANVTYTYTHPDPKFDPVTVAVNAPPVTLGIAVRPITRFAFGLSFVPLGIGSTQKIEKVPLRLPIGTDAKTIALNVQTTQSAYKLAVGGAFRVGAPLTLGFGVLRSSEDSQLLVTDPRDESVPTLEAKYGGAFYQYVLGARSELIQRKLVLAISYRTAVTKAYSGTSVTAVKPDEVADYAGIAYAPAVLGLGGEMRFGSLGLFGGYNREMWSAGRTVASQGLPESPRETDYVDTNNFTGGARLWLRGGHSLSGAVGFYQANIGDGTPFPAPASSSPSSAGTTPTIAGSEFGQLEAIQRLVFAGGYRYHLKRRGYLQTGVHYASGSRVVPEGFSGEGVYTLRVIMLSVGGVYGF